MINPVVRNILLFDRLSRFPAEQIYMVIRGESPQTVAVVLGRLAPKKAREILEYFPAAEQTDLAYRMATAKSIPAEILNEVANVIGGKLSLLEGGASRTQPDGQGKLAEVLKHMDTDRSRKLLDALERKDIHIADRVRRKMFLFEDIANLDAGGLKHVLLKVDIDILALALKGADREIAEAVYGALSGNRRKILKDELSYMGPRLKSDVERARTELLSILRGFFDQGILRMKGDETGEWV